MLGSGPAGRRATIQAAKIEGRSWSHRLECGFARFRKTSRGQIMGFHGGLMKTLFAVDGRRLLGVRVVRPWPRSDGWRW